MVTTIDAMTIVAASRAGKFPVSVARLMTAPSPVVVKVCPWKWKYSATILAFHAPPEAVTKPVIRYGKIPGKSSFRQRSMRLRRYTSQTSLIQLGDDHHVVDEVVDQWYGLDATFHNCLLYTSPSPRDG